MIADLKSDSKRWLMEKKKLESPPKNNTGIGRFDYVQLDSKSNQTFAEEYRTLMTHMSHQYDGPTIESSTVVPQSHDDKAHVPNSSSLT
jgi:hypothetical protein